MRGRWDERLKMREHWDFSLTVIQAGNWRVAFTEDVLIRHVRDNPDIDYQAFRNRQVEFPEGSFPVPG